MAGTPSTPPSTIIYTDPRYRGGRLVNESLLLEEWLGIRYPGVVSSGRLRLGPSSGRVVGITLPPELANMLVNLNWYADAVVLAPSEQLVVEAKVVAKPSAVGEVLWYKTLLQATPALADYLGITFQPVVLFAQGDRALEAWARSLGVRVEVYTPSWIVNYITGVEFRPRTKLSSGPTTPAA